MTSHRFATGLTLAIAAALLSATPVQAVPLTFTIDPTSSVDVVGFVNQAGLNTVAQGAGSDSTFYSGSIQVDVDNLLAPTMLEFLGGSVVAADSGSWLPSSTAATNSGNPGTAEPANYGLELSVFGIADFWLAIRDLEFSPTSGVNAVDGSGLFPSTQTITTTQGISDYTVDFGFLTGEDDFSEHADLTGVSATNAAANGSYVVSGSVATLTVPIDTVLIVTDEMGANVFELTYTGTIVATAPLGGDGDFDDDSDTDGADFLLWQRGGSPDPLSQADLALWETDYGTTSGSLTAFAAVPEPSTWVLLGLAFLLAPLRTKKRA